jgi:RNA polymerase sigma factor (sigma-70 family)
MSSITEHDSWVSLLQNDDDEAFKVLYRQYHHAVFANINRLVNRSPAAEDILQEVFLALWENRHKLNPAHTVAGWLFTASFYKASAYLKKSLRENLAPLYDSLEEAPYEESEYETNYEEKLTAIHTAIALLPPRKKMAFRLCRLEGKSYEEAAQELGLSIESVKDYVKTASRFIRQHVITHHPALICLYAFEISLFFRG